MSGKHYLSQWSANCLTKIFFSILISHNTASLFLPMILQFFQEIEKKLELNQIKIKIKSKWSQVLVDVGFF